MISFSSLRCEFLSFRCQYIHYKLCPWKRYGGIPVLPFVIIFERKGWTLVTICHSTSSSLSTCQVLESIARCKVGKMTIMQTMMFQVLYHLIVFAENSSDPQTNPDLDLLLHPKGFEPDSKFRTMVLKYKVRRIDLLTPECCDSTSCRLTCARNLSQEGMSDCIIPGESFISTTSEQVYPFPLQ